MKKDKIQLVSSTLKTIASENLVSEAELNTEDKPLQEILNAKTQENNEKTPQQGGRE